jgi:hypothetical protein
MLTHKRLFILSVWLFLIVSVTMPPIYAQRAVLSENHRVVLMQMAQDFNYQNQIQRTAALQWARENNVQTRIETKDGRILELMFMDEDLVPVYYETRNQAAAFTTGAMQLQQRGNIRLNLSGKNISAGIWDGGSVLTSHQEFGQRASVKDGGTISNHATHVAGTIGAQGVDLKARGMAPQVNIMSYDWNNDLAEMAQEAANGLILSNHSYGFSLGWGWDGGAWKWNGHNDSLYDYRFGFYGAKSKALDQLAYAAPHYLVVWAAGNDRSDTGNGTRPGDGPFDCIGPEGIAKNVLTVGAVQKLVNPYTSAVDVVMSSFSSWGPADDGRVKPDLVGAGVSIYSATSTSNTSYGNMSGTSMATPNVTGSLVLLQELYKKRHGRFMQAATLKGLAIHTVKQTGYTQGPDYQYGWGLMDAEKAAQMILWEDNEKYFIREINLKQGKSFEMTFEADGSGDIVAVISWTDPAGTPVDAARNPRNRMLVNDLDMRIYNELGDQVFLPWILNVESPVDDATRGDNIRDNVEKITINSPVAGKYLLRVTHKGILESGIQNFALILQTQNTPQMKTLYWIGNSGKWSNPDNWSFNSGGTPASVIPGPNDHVVFDENSFGSDNFPFALEMDGHAKCYSFNWYTDKEVLINGQNNNIDIFTSLFIGKSNNLTIKHLAIDFTGNMPVNEISAGGKGFEDVKITFTGSGSWKALTDLHLNSIEVYNGKLDLSELNIQVKYFIAIPESNIQIDIRNSQISGLHKFVTAEDVDFLAQSGKLQFNNNIGDPDAIVRIAGQFSGDVEIINGVLRIEGSCVFNRLQNAGQLVIEDNFWVKDLELEAGSELTLSGGKILTIENNFNIASLAQSTVKIMAEGEQSAIIHGTSHKKYCFDYLHIAGVDTDGISLFNAGENSTIIKSSGWLTRKCDDLIFADFSYQFACAGGLTHFINLSSGYIDHQIWNFNTDLDNNTSSEWDAYYIFPSPGHYPVSLQVQGGIQNSQVSKVVEVVPNTLTKGSIIVSGIKYTSSSTAPKYQWFLDGKPIPNAIFRNYFNEDGRGGNYQVLIHNDICSMISEPLLVTNTNQHLAVNSDIKVYPNPVKELLYINFEGVKATANQLRIQVIDQSGRVILSEEFRSQFSSVEVGTTALYPGFYIVQIKLDDQMFSKKIIVH